MRTTGRAWARLLLCGAAALAGCGESKRAARERIWQEASEYSKKVKAATTKEQKDRVLAEAAAKLPEWYAGTNIPPPDTAEPGWLRIVIWDMMPEEQFQEALTTYRQKTVGLGGKPLPDNPTRRDLLRAMEEMARRQRDGRK